MFIYEFMSGVADTITGDEDEESYDPHDHRKVEKPTSYSETMTHLLKGSIGAGILAMPDAVSRMGIVYGIVGIVLIGIFATFCIHLLIAAQYELCKRKRRGYLSYPKSMKAAVLVGPTYLHWSANCFPVFVDTVLVMWQLGLCTVYTVFVAENIKQVCDYYGFIISVRVHLCLVLMPLVVVNMVKDLKLLTPLSSISNLVTIFGLLLVFFYLVEDDVDLDEKKMQIKRLIDVPVFVGITLFALEAVGVILALEYNMENPKRFLGLFGLFNVGMVIILSLYILVGVCGYLKYGDDVKASLTLNLPQEQKKAQTAKVVFALAIFLTFPLQNFVAYNILWRKLKKRTDPTHHCISDYALRLALIFIPWLVAVAIPKLGPFISLFGALCLSLLALIFPGLMDACLWYSPEHGATRFRLIRDTCIIIIGVLCLVSGVYTSILEITHSAQETQAVAENELLAEENIT